MRNYSMLVWLTQLGLSVAAPLAGFLLLALWLRSQFGWGNWVIWVGLFLGINGAVSGLRVSLKAMEQMSKPKDKPADPPISFNDHF